MLTEAELAVLGERMQRAIAENDLEAFAVYLARLYRHMLVVQSRVMVAGIRAAGL